MKNVFEIIKKCLILLPLLLLLYYAPEEESRAEAGQEIPEDLSLSGVSVLYLNVTEGAMERVHADKEHKESAAYSFYNPAGECTAAGGCTVFGRGNSTWADMEENLGHRDFKHPYSITLDRPQVLAGETAAKKYVLLANAHDPSHLRNRIALYLAEKAEIPFTPACAYTNVFINGEYAGLYLLTERIAKGGAFRNAAPLLCFAEEARREGISWVTFDTERRLVEVVLPQKAESGLTAQLAETVQYAEDVLYATDVLAQYAAVLDVESWAKLFMLQEILVSMDMDDNSQFFYPEEGSGLLVAGPAWDFDITMGHGWAAYQGMETQSLWHASRCRHWLHRMGESAEFRALCARVYLEEISPVLEEILTERWEEWTAQIVPSVLADQYRWKPQFGYAENVDALRAWLEARKAFADAYYADPGAFHLLRFYDIPEGKDSYEVFLTYGVRRGEAVFQLPLSGHHDRWADAAGNELLPDTRITSDLELFPLQEQD